MINFQHYSFGGKRALIRVDYNVPLDDQLHVTDDTRISATLGTLNHILRQGGSVVLMSHLGRPKGGPEGKFSLRHIIPALRAVLGGEHEIQFADDCISERAFAQSAALQPGQILLLENLRFYKEEEKGDEAFAEKLARHGDVYINDAFGTAHRAHASTAVIARYFADDAKGFGLVMGSEIANADRVLEHTERPFVAILGGAKVSGKIMIIERLLEKADIILIGGGMSYTFAKAAGGSVGTSMVEEDRLDTARRMVELAKAKGVALLLPIDSVIADNFSNDATRKVASNDAIPDGWMGLDIGEKTIARFREAILRSRTILWNGPMGVFEMPNFQQGTMAIAQAIADATAKGAFSLVGGGDSVAAVNQFGFADQVSYVSTGGGAMLEYFEGKELPGIAAIASQ
ncbi:MAG: phosphoglycerate kinase [Bacteroidetes bacterium]|nr:phosphoglycerate kinase [Bacteroidota bacterium]